MTGVGRSPTLSPMDERSPTPELLTAAPSHPSLAATEDLAGRLPLRLHIDVVAERFAPAIESAAWFVVAEGVSNAVKHARTDEVRITAERMEGTLVVVVQDDGAGGAQPHGSGLQGLADRLAAHGGQLKLSSSPMSGTRLEAVLPCGS